MPGSNRRDRRRNGLSTLLSGLKKIRRAGRSESRSGSGALAAIVAVSDDGGSSGGCVTNSRCRRQATSAIAWSPCRKIHCCCPDFSSIRFSGDGDSGGTSFRKSLSRGTFGGDRRLCRGGKIVIGDLRQQGTTSIPATVSNVQIAARLRDGRSQVRGEDKHRQGRRQDRTTLSRT